MKVLVLGAGVVGVATAWFLRRRGAEVTVLDRQPGPGLETSYANAGQLSYGMSSPWAGPGVPLKAIKWLMMKRAPLRIRPMLDPDLVRWGAQLLANCTTEAYARNKGRMVRVSDYSREVLGDLMAEAPLAFDQREAGTLQVFRTDKQMKGSQADRDILAAFGYPFELLDRDGCIAAEPGLAHVRDKIVGGLRYMADRTGDCRMFTQALADRAAEAGVRFRWGETIIGLSVDGDLVTGVDTAEGREIADAYVVATGVATPRLLRPLGLRLPIYPVKGYSITLPVADPEAAPVSTVMDETHKVAITRLGDRIRVAGTAELAGHDDRLGARATEVVKWVVSDLFPKGGDVARAEGWTGLRPMTPDGTPIMGPTPYANLFLNTGHGTLGWTMAAGAGKAVADLVTRGNPQIDFDGLTLARYAA